MRRERAAAWWSRASARAATAIAGEALLPCFHDAFVWRVAGFPCEFLEQFALVELADDVARIAASDCARPAPADLSALRRRFDALFQQRREELARVVKSPRFQLAVSMSSPDAARYLTEHPVGPLETRRADDKRRELLAMRYAQRFVAKCETSAFFGPVSRGRIHDVPETISSVHDPRSYHGRAFLSYRLLADLTRLLRATPSVLRTLTVGLRSGAALAPDGTIVHPHWGRLALGPPSRSILASVSSSPQSVATLLRNAPDEESCLETVAALLRIGVLRDDLDSLWESDDPLAEIHAIVDHEPIPRSVRLAVRELGNALSRWRNGDASGRIEAVTMLAGLNAATGLDVEHPARFYADHMPFFEDGSCTESFLEIDRAWAVPWLTNLDGYLRSNLVADERRLHRLGSAVRRVLSLRCRNEVPLSEFVSLFAEHPAHIVPADEDVESAPAHFVPSRPRISCPDVMFAASSLDALKAGEYRCVLGEAHSGIGLAGFFVRALSDRDAWLASISRFIEERVSGVERVAVTPALRNKTCFYGRIETLKYLEVGSRAPEGGATVALSDFVVRVEEGLELVHRPTGKRAFVVSDDDRGSALECFRIPRFTPPVPETSGVRLTSGSLVVARARWELRDANAKGRASADPFDVFAWAQQLRNHLRLPRWIFARPAGEAKPICIDTANPFLCEELARLVRRESPLVVEEMYPSPADAWVSGPGGRYLCELRLLHASAS